MEVLVHLLCGAGHERAIELLGAPSSACARCTGFYLAFALGILLYRRARRAPLALALAVAATLLQVATESLGGIASTPTLRLVLGVAVGLPLGSIAAGRMVAAVRRPLGIVALASLAIATAGFALAEPRWLELAIVIDMSLALAVVAVMVAALVRPPPPEPQQERP